MGNNKKRYFGTDGIRGIANQGSLAVEQVLRLGQASARVLARQLKRSGRIGLGWDTRISSPALVSALSAGLSSFGAQVWRFGVIPTPAVSFLTRHYQLDAGIVVSASHNPAEDNGIKYFAGNGGKFPDRNEILLEKELRTRKPGKVRNGITLGPILDLAGEAVNAYTQVLVKQYEPRQLSDLRLVMDLAQGAVCRTAPRVMDGLKVWTKNICDQPDGVNINVACGSTHLQTTQKQMRKQSADAGLAFDGDGDRVMLLDEHGAVVNGDRILGILALHYARHGGLRNRVVVATVMSNLGLELFLKAKGIRLVRTQVGDRYVAETLSREQGILGGEQSGHILLPRLSPTGDGLLTALEVLSALRASGLRLSELAAGWQDFPQLLVNIPVKSRPALATIPGVKKALVSAQQALKDRGRINLRYSGTENLARVMVEAEDVDQAAAWAHGIGDEIEKAIGIGKRRTATWLTCA